MERADGGRHASAGGTSPEAPAGDRSVTYLLGRLELVEARVRAEVMRRREQRALDEDERWRGLFVSELRVDELLDEGPLEPVSPSEAAARRLRELEAIGDDVEARGTSLRLRVLARSFGLGPLDVELLLIALAPDLDPRFEPLYGYLNDDVSLRRATVGMALVLSGMSLASARARSRLGPSGPLVHQRLVMFEDEDRPALSRTLRVQDRVVAFLLGDDTVDAALIDRVLRVPAMPGRSASEVAAAIADGATSVYLLDRRGAAARSAAVAGLEEAGLAPLVLDLARMEREGTTATILAAATREARLRGAGLVVGPVEVLADGEVAAIRELVEDPSVTVLHGGPQWDPAWAAVMPTHVVAERVTEGLQATLWHDVLGDALADGTDPVATTSLFRLTPEQIVRAGISARRQAALRGGPVTAADLLRGARAQNAAGLQRLARRVEPTANWQDLILPSDVHDQLKELGNRWRLRDVVLDDWQLGQGAARGRGVSALFAGESGTGKTLASEVIARDLGLDLYLVDLSTVVDKYIGETSKNLERIFDEADRVNGVLLFDEADALFGKRSAVSDAKDRHANVEVAYLLQRMETFDGVAILTTNLAANLDEAFMRRLDAIVDFPSPDEPQRLSLWEAKLRPEIPQADDLDLPLLAERFKLSGSEIHNIVVSAAYRAASGERRVDMRELVRATVREHRKIGRHLSSADLAGLTHLLESSP